MTDRYVINADGTGSDPAPPQANPVPHMPPQRPQPEASWFGRAFAVTAGVIVACTVVPLAFFAGCAILGGAIEAAK